LAVTPGCCGNQRNLPADQIGRHLWEMVESAFRPAIFDCDVAAVHETGFSEALPERA
jgi:hypothetical protein